MTDIEDLCINTIRILSAEAVERANSGHPGLPMGAAPMAYTLWSRHMKHNPDNPGWINRDRFVLSAGHGSMLLYSLLHLFGYGLEIEEIKAFRQLGSLTPGHPEYKHTPGVETTTGPLGQGFANGVGMAVAEAKLAAEFNTDEHNIVDHYTYVLSGDGCMMEGITSEAASLAGSLKLGRLIVFYDSNGITIEGATDLAFTENVQQRFEAYGWQVVTVEDGNDTEEISKAILIAQSEKTRPSLIIVNTVIGYGCPTKQGKPAAHGEPLGEESLKAAKEFLKWPLKEAFRVPQEVRKQLKNVREKLKVFEHEWNRLWEDYKVKYPEKSEKLLDWFKNDYTEKLGKAKELFALDNKNLATRAASGEMINRLSGVVENLVGGSADLAPSNKTIMKERSHFSADNNRGSNLHFGVREHAMAAIANGMLLHGGLTVYVSTFFVFSDYMKPAMRLSSIMKLPVIYVLTHDSIGVGEDGPTHQPVEQLAALRSIPGFTVLRPADARETTAAWYYAVTSKEGPVALILTRQNVPPIENTSDDTLKGAYIISDSSGSIPDLILIGTGSELKLALEAGKELSSRGLDVRVVSMPSWELFEKQSEEYKRKVLPPRVRTRLAVEAAATMGWHKYTGSYGLVIGIDRFGASGSFEAVFKEVGLTTENIVKKALELHSVNSSLE